LRADVPVTTVRRPDTSVPTVTSSVSPSGLQSASYESRSRLVATFGGLPVRPLPEISHPLAVRSTRTC
jgi:hypothetical protein